MKVVCLGDSLTFGYKMKRKDTWPEVLKKETNIEFVNKGINGDTTAGMLSRFEMDVIREKPSHVLIMGGTNDLVWQIPFEIIKSNIAALVFQAYHHRIRPILGVSIPIIPYEAKTNFQIDVFEDINEKLKLYRQWILEFTSFARHTKCKCVDIYSVFYDPITNEGKKELYIDGLHPTVEGNKKIAQYIISELDIDRIKQK